MMVEFNRFKFCPDLYYMVKDFTVTDHNENFGCLFLIFEKTFSALFII